MNVTDCLTMVNAIEAFVEDFNENTCQQFYGEELGKQFFNKFGPSLQNLQGDPPGQFYTFCVETCFNKPDQAKLVNAAFQVYYNAQND